MIDTAISFSLNQRQKNQTVIIVTFLIEWFYKLIYCKLTFVFWLSVKNVILLTYIFSLFCKLVLFVKIRKIKSKLTRNEWIEWYVCLSLEQDITALWKMVASNYGVMPLLFLCSCISCQMKINEWAEIVLIYLVHMQWTCHKVCVTQLLLFLAEEKVLSIW